MQTNAAAHQWRTSLAWSAVFRSAGLSIFGLSSGVALLGGRPTLEGSFARRGSGSCRLVGVAWYVPRARIERRWRAALDLYAEQEQAKETYPWRNSRH